MRPMRLTTLFLGSVLFLASCNMPHPPTVTRPANQVNTVGEAVNLMIQATDPDGDVLQYSLSGQPDGLSINSASGKITGSLTKANSFNVTVTAKDGKAGSDSKSFAWVVNPVPPPATTLVISPKTVTSTASGSTQVFTAALNGTGTVNWQLDNPVGTLSSTTGASVTYTPPTTSIATDRMVNLTATLQGTSVTDTAAITISGTSTPPATTLVISPKTVALAANGSTQAFSATLNGTGVVNWQLDSTVGTLSSSTGSSVTYTSPIVSTTTDRTVHLTASLQGTSATDGATITISGASTPPAPSVTNPGDKTNAVTDGVNLQIQATASAGGALAYLATGLPDGLTLDGATGIISGVPNMVKAYNVKVTVNETGGGSSNVSFAWDVTKANGLVGWWRFDEGSNATAFDSSGNGNDGTILNGNFGGAKVGASALEMDGGNNSIVNIPISDSLRTTDKKITVMAWAYLNDWNHVDIIGHSYPFVFFGFHNEKDTGTRAFKWQVATKLDTDCPTNDCRSTIFAQPNASQPMNLGTWYHLAGTYDGTTVTLYVNGQEFGSDSFSKVLPMPNTDFTISGFRDPDTNVIKDEINGKIDDVRLYNRALSATEIQNIYNSQK